MVHFLLSEVYLYISYFVNKRYGEVFFPLWQDHVLKQWHPLKIRVGRNEIAVRKAECYSFLEAIRLMLSSTLDQKRSAHADTFIWSKGPSGQPQ
jgi:hypothetical protein